MIKYRAETFMKGQKVEGLYYKEAGVEGKHIIRACYNAVDYYVIPETLEIFLFGEWRLVSELETRYVLVEKQPIDDLKSYEDVSRKPVVKKADLLTRINEIKELAKGKQ